MTIVGGNAPLPFEYALGTTSGDGIFDEHSYMVSSKLTIPSLVFTASHGVNTTEDTNFFELNLVIRKKIEINK